MSRDGIMSKPYASFPRPGVVPTHAAKKPWGLRYRYLRPSFCRQVPQIWGGTDGGAGSRSGKQLAPWYNGNEEGSLENTGMSMVLRINGWYMGYFFTYL